MSDRAEVFDPTPCALGEGPLWHPEAERLYWFDILKFRLYGRAPGEAEARLWQFDEHVSAAGWIDAARLLVASETRLFVFDTETGASETVAGLEAERPETRSNDGRADPFGGFWIGTMGKGAEDGAGAIYRYYRGEVRKLFPGVTIPNAIAFAPDGRTAYFGDTRARRVWRQALSEADGWPEGAPDVFLDLEGTGRAPDGAVVDAGGNFWNAQWGMSCVAVYAPDGTHLRDIPVEAPHSSCPAFGGPGLADLYCTTARMGLSAEILADGRAHGATFVAERAGRGQAEHRVFL